MGKKHFAICDSNEVYAKKLYEYFFAEESDSYEMLLFTKLQDLQQYLSKSHIEILLITEEMCEENSPICNADHIFVLKSDETGIQSGNHEIYKYKSGDSILKEVMNYCAQSGEMKTSRLCSKPLHIIGIYSPIKRCFQTTFAITVGQILAKKGKAIYLNFEAFSGFDVMRKNASKQDLSDLIYFLRCGSESFAFRLQSMVSQIGELHFVSPNHSYISKLNIRGAEWIELLSSFEEYTDYEYLILDLSENMMGLFDVLRECSLVYTITAGDNISKAKMAQYETLLRENDYSDVYEKTRVIDVPVFKEIPQELEMLPFSELAKYGRKKLKEAGLI